MSITQTVMSAIEPCIESVADKARVTPEKVRQATPKAVPLLLGALSQKPKGSKRLRMGLRYIDRVHGGSVLEDMDYYLNGTARGPDLGVVTKLLQDQQIPALEALADQASMSYNEALRLMAVVAPIVLSRLTHEPAPVAKLDDERFSLPGAAADILEGARSLLSGDMDSLQRALLD